MKQGKRRAFGDLHDFVLRRTEIAIFVFVIILGAVFAWYVYDIGLTKELVDQNSHLNISRQIVDSMTPGLSQTGLWPPLIHIVMAPTVMIDTLFTHGVAGAVALVPLLGIGAVMFYRLILLFVPGRLVALLGALLFVTNPYVLYYAVTPMTDLLFIVTAIGVAYFFALWMKSDRLAHLIYAALFVVAAGLTRFEGFVFIPVVALAALFHLRGKKKRAEIEAVLVLFGTIAMLSVGYTLAYSWIFAGDPLAFMTNPWSASAQQEDYTLPAKASIVNSFQYALAASRYMIGPLQIALAFLAFLASIVASRKEKQMRDMLLVIFSVFAAPLLFDVLALYAGNAVLYVPELPPYGSFYNERYGLYWIGFVILAPFAYAAVLTANHRKRGSWIGGEVGRAAASALVVIMLLANLTFFYHVAFAQKFSVVRASAEGFLARDQRALAGVLAREYDGGKIFITRALQNFVTVDAGIPLKNYIHESNYPYYDQTLERPWLFARWVVMYNPEVELAAWRKRNELISGKWAYSDTFAQAYELVYENDTERLYRLRDDVILNAAIAQGVEPLSIPSLNPALARWDPEGVYREMGIQGENEVTNTGVQGVQARELDKSTSIFFR